ncbi:isoprenoid synthase domain-containing protein [Sordaria brevicollis]|uniref:Isoprenoid synthase domain-containing protein n=1 Tax=Sordaria brevicollis TaxID=83679 RepID=A0AAE0PFX6_SORBR|nr:isoprenoid synthase domain-containing protein [Sordaria brevicollis]
MSGGSVFLSLGPVPNHAGYTLRRHKAETLANAGCYEARQDWIQYIGPIKEFGNCNPVNGNFTALVLPLTKPERLRLVAYILEYAFLHDNVVEVAKEDGSSSKDGNDNDAFSLGDMETSQQNAKLGRKQIQAKMMLQLTQTDPVCAKRVMGVWQTMLETTKKDKSKSFADLEEYLEFRIIDTGAPFAESLMLFGMGETLTKEEDALLAPIIRPCHASLALANDYFSFDREWTEYQDALSSSSSSDVGVPINGVYLYTQWQNVDIPTAKQLVREAANRFEADFLQKCQEFRESGKSNEKLDRYLRGLSYQITGNVVWSLNCPRYHPEMRYDPNKGLEDQLTAERRERPVVEQVEDVDVETTERLKRLSIASWQSRESDSDISTTSSSWEERVASRSSSFSAMSSDEEGVPGFKGFKNTERREKESLLPSEEKLGMDIVNAPFEYTRSMPSGNVRGTFIDALNLWAGLPEEVLAQIKEVVDDLHTASLMFDDVEDGSELRRGSPAAHAVYGIPQTINSASLAILEAVRKAKDLPIPGAVDIALEQLRDLHVGQSYDLYWTRHMSCPSESEYLEMVAKKTGGLFLLLSRLMSEHMPQEVRSLVNDLVTQVGIYFQIRDDYQNLSSDEYTAQKGFCEDLDEGKLSFPLVHYLNTEQNSSNSQQVREVLQERQQKGSLSMPLKLLTLQKLKSSNSLSYTKDTLKRLEGDVDGTIEELERLTGRENWVLRMCMAKLSV